MVRMPTLFYHRPISFVELCFPFYTVLQGACLSLIFVSESVGGFRSDYRHFTFTDYLINYKMVSVRTTDNAVSRDPDDVIQACDAESVPKLCIGAIDKKVRNLEKRKVNKMKRLHSF